MLNQSKHLLIRLKLVSHTFLMQIQKHILEILVLFKYTNKGFGHSWVDVINPQNQNKFDHLDGRGRSSNQEQRPGESHAPAHVFPTLLHQLFISLLFLLGASTVTPTTLTDKCVCYFQNLNPTRFYHFQSFKNYLFHKDGYLCFTTLLFPLLCQQQQQQQCQVPSEQGNVRCRMLHRYQRAKNCV